MTYKFEGQVPGRTWGRFQNRTTGPAPYQPQRPDPRGPPPNQVSGLRQGDYRNNGSQSRVQNNGGTRGQNNGQRADRQNQQNNLHSSQNGNKKAPPKRHQTVYTPEKLAELVSGMPQCFTCEQPGHISRNCPQRQKARAPNVQLGAGSVRFEHLEDLADKARRTTTDIYVGAVAFTEDTDAETIGDSEDTDTDPYEPMDGSVLTEAGKLVRAKFLAYFDDEEAEAAGLNPAERFSFWCTDTTVEVTDRVPAAICERSFLDSYEITLEQLAEPRWTVSDAVQEAWKEWVTMPAPPDWADGFPDCRTRHNGHPALYWLRACVDKYMTAEYPQLMGTQDLMKVNPYKMGILTVVRG
ncbi:transcription factor [Ganoderma sinense ZZ0214-1]|uniref:Transcription factor n=1 Tax=Ganoderma sinense ZZ0214-1 TaxID=1077348 RepID=A0A2G8RZH0_9APHY|nr:transcription factor [Ganoderma sinense ZZ0214-1]